MSLPMECWKDGNSTHLEGCYSMKLNTSHHLSVKPKIFRNALFIVSAMKPSKNQ